MREFMKTWLVALLVALLPSVAGAAGMGRLNVLSSLGQPLVAEIDLVSVTREELGSLSARIANPDTYRQANLQYNPALTGARVSVERRPSGQHFLKVISTRPVAEPFIDLLIELTWAAGRLSREYTALLDPPGVTPAPAPAPVVSAVPESRPAPQPQPQAAAPAASRPVTPAGPMAGGKEYGPIQRGETLGKIAREVMPEGVTLEQMLVALYRNNPDAFIRKNLNLVRAGKILRVPDREEVAAITRSDAVSEYRTHVADWNSYRQRVAEAAGTVPAEGRTAVSGKISAKVEDKTAGTPKDVVKLSKGETPGAAAGKGKPRSSAERMRMLEEEAVAREKALTEANQRITQLEKTIQDMKKLVELKSPGMAAAQQQAAQQAAAPKPEPKAAVKPEPVKPEAVAVAKPEPAKPEPAPVAKPEAAKKAEQATAPAPKKAEPAKAKPAPKKEPELMDQIMEAATDPLYLGAGGGALVIGGLAFWMARRRRGRAADENAPRSAPSLTKAAAAAAGAAAVSADTTAATDSAPQAAGSTEDVDPLAEAEVYIAYGRDAQAEEILKEALAKDPTREEVQLKLLEIYSARKDKSAFGKVAGDLNKQTGGAGNNWLKAAGMGYALDPANAMYAAGKNVAAAVPSDAGVAEIDLDLGIGDTGTATDITLEAGAADAAAGADTGILDVGTHDRVSTAAMPAFNLDVPAPERTPAPAAPAEVPNMLDFQIELPKAAENPPTKATPPAAAADAGLDFKLDDLNLSLDAEPSKPQASGGEKDGHWYDVQTKFDLAKAYQEMGDKDGAKEILQEVLKEGDAEQKAQARTLMDSLG